MWFYLNAYAQLNRPFYLSIFALKITIKAADGSIFQKFQVELVKVYRVWNWAMVKKNWMTGGEFVDKYLLEDQSLDF